jgi:outer membrane protein assembly factor BamD (BamD/ComL family)
VGNKSSRTWKYFLFYFAVSFIVAGLNIVSCAPVQDKIAVLKAHQQLEQYRESMAAGFFETIIEQSEQVLAENETEPPADIILYVLGEVYAHPAFAGRDYALSQYYFEKLIENFPDSQLTSEAITYISLFETIAAREKEITAAEQKTAQTEIPIEKEEKPIEKEEKTASVTETRQIVANKNFTEAVRRNLQILAESGEKKPADEALYNLGLIYAHVDNPAKDYQKSQAYFNELTKQFPDSDLAEEARIWLGLFETIEKIQQIDIEIEQQKKQLTR